MQTFASRAEDRRKRDRRATGNLNTAAEMLRGIQDGLDRRADRRWLWPRRLLWALAGLLLYVAVLVTWEVVRCGRG